MCFASLRGVQQMSRIFINNNDMITSKSSKHLQPCVIIAITTAEISGADSQLLHPPPQQRGPLEGQRFAAAPINKA